MKFSTAFMIMMAVAMTGAAFAARAADTPVTATIADADAMGVALRVRSDGSGAYTNSRSVQSIIQDCSNRTWGTCHDWVLDTNYARTSTRAVVVDLGDPILGSGPAGADPVAPFSSAVVKGRFISKCHETQVDMFTIAAGSTAICPMNLAFNYGGTDYRLVMNPASYANTNWIDVTCQSAGSNGRCNRWLLEPSAVYGTAKNSTKLLKLDKSGNAIDQGDFYLSFSIGVTNP